MSILIKGMEVPTGCGKCPISVYGDCDAVSPRKKLPKKYRWSADDRPDWCPLIPVPNHGRLIDAEALLTDTTNLHVDVLADWVYVKISTVEDAPTIIPAEEG